MTVNPFDDDNGTFLVLINNQAQHSLWPAFADIPDGWRAVFGAADRPSCLDFVDAHWVDIRPKTLRDRLAGEPVTQEAHLASSTGLHHRFAAGCGGHGW